MKRVGPLVILELYKSQKSASQVLKSSRLRLTRIYVCLQRTREPQPLMLRFLNQVSEYVPLAILPTPASSVLCLRKVSHANPNANLVTILGLGYKTSLILKWHRLITSLFISSTQTPNSININNWRTICAMLKLNTGKVKAMYTL